MDGNENRTTRAGRTLSFTMPPVTKIPSAPAGAEDGVVSTDAHDLPAPRSRAGSNAPPFRGLPAAETGPAVPALEIVKPVTGPLLATASAGQNALMSDDTTARSADPTAGATSAPAIPAAARSINAAGEVRSPFLPLLLGALALVAWFGVQSWLLRGERSALQATHASQQQTVENAAKLRQSLDGIAADTQRLADTGNANARLLVEELRKRGVTINPNAAGMTGGSK
jgi:hypothetical protein